MIASLLVLQATKAAAQHHHHGGGDPDAGVAAPDAAAANNANDPGGLDQAARLLFESARTAFNAGDYETALQRFQQAYSASPRPLLLYNIGTTLDRLRRDEEALHTFEQFVAAVPDSPNRAEIEGRIRVLREAIDARHAQEAAERAQQEQQARDAEAARQRTLAEEEARRREQERHRHPPPTTPAASAGLPLPVFIATAGVAGAALIAGGIFGGLTLSANDDYTSHAMAPGATYADIKSRYDNAASMQLLTNVFLFGGAAVAIAAGVLAFLTDWGGGGQHEDQAGTTTATVSLGEHHLVLGTSTSL